MLLQFPKRRIVRGHGRASAGIGLACSVASASKVTSISRSLAKSTISRHRSAGIEPRARQELTVDAFNPSALATVPVPPNASMMSAIDDMGALIVRKLRTGQVFANCETTFPEERVALWGMIDAPEFIGPRLKALRKACECKTQVAFAKQIGVEKNTYNPWETGKRELTFEGALLIRKRYKIPLDYLFFGEAREEIPGRILKRLDDAA